MNQHHCHHTAAEAKHAYARQHSTFDFIPMMENPIQELRRTVQYSSKLAPLGSAVLPEFTRAFLTQEAQHRVHGRDTQ